MSFEFLVVVGIYLSTASVEAQSFRVTGTPESNRNFRIEYPASSSAYYLISSCDALTGTPIWSVTGLLLGVEGTQTWRDDDALTETLRRFYRVGYRDLNAPADSDSDGMDDVWELRHGLAPLNPADAEADPDADGFTNLQEYQAGADPQVFDPAPELTITSPRDGGLLP